MPDLDKTSTHDEEDVSASTETSVSLTDPKTGLTDDQVEAAREKYGINEIPVHETPLYMLFLRQFMGFLPLLIELAAVISLAVQDFIDFAIIAGILLVNAILGFHEEYKAKKSLDEISQSLDSEITVRRNGECVNINTKDLVPGDIVILGGGVVVPADCKWISGDKMEINTSSLTGEPLPRKYPSDEHGDVILSGTTVVSGDCNAQVVLIGTDTEMGQAQADVLQDKSVRVVSVFQRKIMKVVQMLVTACFGMVVAVLLIEGLVYGGFDHKVKETILDALSILIASIPVALPLVLQVNMALGASFLAKEHHAIVTSIPALQDIASMSMLCSDKTGTLTTADMSVKVDNIVPSEGYTENDVILYAYLCSNLDKIDDPIDHAMVKAFEESKYKDSGSDYKQTEIIGFNASVKRVVTFVQHGEETLTIAKGLPAKILDTSSGSEDEHELQWKVQGNDDKEFVETITNSDIELTKVGYKTIAVAICKGDARKMHNPVWNFVGLLPMLDPPREDTKATVESLHRANISLKLITGDHVNVGKETARLVGLGTDFMSGEEVRKSSEGDERNKLIWEADGFGAVLPSDKREIVLTLHNVYGLVVGMTGDGVNDAPALSAAQVGIAVEGATDAAKNAADLILTEPGLAPIYGAILESRRIFARIKAYVIYRVAASIILVLTLSIIIFATGCAVSSLLVIILALLNDLSMIPVAYDNAKATIHPQLPYARKLVTMSVFYGAFHSIASLLFIFLMDVYSDQLREPIDLETCNNHTGGFIWLHLVLVTELMIFSVRSPSYMVLSMPAMSLVASVLLTCAGATFIAVYATGVAWLNVAWIYIVNLGILLLADVGKVFVRKLINDSAGEVIESDELVDVTPTEKTDEERQAAKKKRYDVHNQSRLSLEDRQHLVEIRSQKQVSGLQAFFNDMRGTNIGGGFIKRSREHDALLAHQQALNRINSGTDQGQRQKQSSLPW